jgi:hypothetical protein
LVNNPRVIKLAEKLPTATTMAATTQALEALSASLNERINGLGLRMNATDEGLQKYEQMITTQFIEMSTKFEKAISQPGDVVHNAIQAIVRDAHDQLLNRMVELEKKIEKKPEKSEHRWNIKDPKARGTVKFSGDKKDDVRAFTQWRKHAVIYLEKFVPNLGKFLTAYTAAKTGEVFDVAQELFNLDIDLNYAELDDIMHYFLFEHLTDSAADLVESCGDKGFAMWKMINQYYEPQSQSTHANIHAAVYEMARKKAKTPGEMHGLLREFEKRLVKLEQIKGTISDIAKASIVYNMMDDATQKTICDGGHNDDFEYMRLKIIREGCESRERSIVKNNKATPMEIDSLEGRDVPDPFLCEPTIGEVNAVTNPNIVCFICKEKGHIARQCPHNEGKNRMSNHSKGDDWWYAAKGGGKGKGQKGKSKGKGKYGNGKGAGRKGYGKAYSLENADDWEADWWLDNASNIGSIRSLERLSMLQHVKPVQTIVEEFEKAEFCTPRGSSPDIKVAIQKSEPKFKGKLKYKPTDSFNEALHNSISYNKMVEAFRHEEKAVIHKAKIIPAKIIPTTNSSEKKFNKEKKPKMKPTNGDKKKIIDIVEFENISDGIIEASLDAPPGWVVDSPEAQWEILKATLVPGYRTAEQRREERRTAMAVEKYEEMRRKEASSTPADACSLTPNGVIGSHQVDHIGHSISELSGEIKRGGIALRADEAKLAEHPELVDSDDEEELSEIIDSSDDEEDLPLVENLPMDEYMTVLENNFRKHRPVTVDETITELVMKTGHAARSDDEGDHGGDHGGVHRHQGDHRGDRGNDHRALDGDGGRDRKAPPVKSPSHATKASEERRRELLEKCRSPQRDRRNPTPRESLKSCYNDIVPVQDVEEDFLMTDGSEWVKVALKKPRKGVHLLREIRDGALSTVAAPEWVEITVTVDSGASETVAPLDMATHIPIDSSEASLRGVAYEVANGQIIANKGEKNCIVQVAGGSAKLLSFQVCDVHKPLLSVSRLCEAGNAVVFHPVWSYIENLKTGERTTIEKKDGLYELKAWIRAAKGFGRQGQTA